MRSMSLIAKNKKRKSESKNSKYGNFTENTNEKMI